jgi:uncharacterized protein
VVVSVGRATLSPWRARRKRVEAPELGRYSKRTTQLCSCSVRPGRGPAKQGRVEGITRLEKLLFLLENETAVREWLKEDAGFSSNNFGPFSSKSYQEIETLVAAGLVRDSAELSSTPEDSWESEHIIGATQADPYATRTFDLTEQGWRYYKELLKELPKHAESEVTHLKRRFASVPLRQLVRYVYQRYPDFTDRSIIRDEILDQ